LGDDLLLLADQLEQFLARCLFVLHCESNSTPHLAGMAPLAHYGPVTKSCPEV
jgi:hypothetical protein